MWSMKIVVLFSGLFALSAAQLQLSVDGYLNPRLQNVRTPLASSASSDKPYLSIPIVVMPNGKVVPKPVQLIYKNSGQQSNPKTVNYHIVIPKQLSNGQEKKNSLRSLKMRKTSGRNAREQWSSGQSNNEDDYQQYQSNNHQSYPSFSTYQYQPTNQGQTQSTNNRYQPQYQFNGKQYYQSNVQQQNRNMNQASTQPQLFANQDIKEAHKQHVANFISFATQLGASVIPKQRSQSTPLMSSSTEGQKSFDDYMITSQQQQPVNNNNNMYIQPQSSQMQQQAMTQNSYPTQQQGVMQNMPQTQQTAMQNIPQTQQKMVMQNMPQVQQQAVMQNIPQMLQQPMQNMPQMQQYQNIQTVPQMHQQHPMQNIPQMQQQQTIQNIPQMYQQQAMQNTPQTSQPVIMQNIPQMQQQAVMQNIPQMQQQGLMHIPQVQQQPQSMQYINRRPDQGIEYQASISNQAMLQPNTQHSRNPTDGPLHMQDQQNDLPRKENYQSVQKGYGSNPSMPSFESYQVGLPNNQQPFSIPHQNQNGRVYSSQAGSEQNDDQKVYVAYQNSQGSYPRDMQGYTYSNDQNKYSLSEGEDSGSQLSYSPPSDQDYSSLPYDRDNEDQSSDYDSYPEDIPETFSKQSLRNTRYKATSSRPQDLDDNGEEEEEERSYKVVYIPLDILKNVLTNNNVDIKRSDKIKPKSNAEVS